MTVTRRAALEALVSAGAASAAGASPLRADEARELPDDAVGMLFDTTKCVGCRACVTACREAHDDPCVRSTQGMELYDAPTTLDSSTRNLIQLYAEDDGEHSFVKRQCMHCVDPACANACMLGALQKREMGVVTWDPEYCVGCRYCQVACPFNIPKFEWHSTNPRIVKCDMCIERLRRGQQPACCEACPRGAVSFGRYEDLLEEAHRRIRDHPDRYVPRVYGENEVGGTQVLYLSHVPFEDIGFELDQEESVPSLQRSIQHGIYQGFIAPVALYAILGGVMLRHKRVEAKKARKTEEGQ